ncbi:hypothetical protein [Novipirellula artificiosorum]|uniref:hypothetical protein n=1 Tax=Novipirellula artificiosorum TaxID=2528016 RepID=UPI0011B7E30A|nr:hypothetical protein [Novipirellula artificiosorum]
MTALIFGRHHPIFDSTLFIQVRQKEPGELTLIVTVPAGCEWSDAEVLKGFDLTNLNFQFAVERRREPIRTASGKLPLKVT